MHCFVWIRVAIREIGEQEMFGELALGLNGEIGNS